LRPEPLFEALSEAGTSLAPRLLYAWPEPPSYCPLKERPVARDEQALDLLRRIHRLARTPPVPPLVLPLDGAATAIFDGFLSLLPREQQQVEGLEADWLGKGPGTVARLSGLLEMLAWSGSDTGAPPKHVGGPAVQAAVRLWSDHFRPHALQVFGRVET